MSKSFKNKVIIENNIVKKKSKEDLAELFDYLESRNFNCFPKVLNINDKYIETEYINSKKYYEMTEGEELIKTMALLHSKTILYKEISKNKYKNIYDKLLGNINYLKKYYERLIDNIELEEFMSPSHYLFARNYSLIDSSLNYSLSELKKWYKLVNDKEKERVSIVHNNICLDHFLKNENNYLISWDKNLVDTPILDIYNFYKKDGYKLDFTYLLDVYNQNFELLKEEKILLNVLISIPPKLEEIKNEYLNTININNFIDYVHSGIKVVNKNK